MLPYIFFAVVIVERHMADFWKVVLFTYYAHYTQFIFEEEVSDFLFCHFFPQASMLTSPDGPFINLSRLNLMKYAQKPKLAKVCT